MGVALATYPQAAVDRQALRLPSETVAMPAPISRPPPVRLTILSARGLATKPRARLATSAYLQHSRDTHSAKRLPVAPSFASLDTVDRGYRGVEARCWAMRGAAKRAPAAKRITGPKL